MLQWKISHEELIKLRKVEKIMYCVKCGAKIEEGAKVCPECNANVELGVKDFTNFAGRKAKGFLDKAKSKIKSNKGVDSRLSDLSKLKELLDSGAISLEEYEVLKQEIIQKN